MNIEEVLKDLGYKLADRGSYWQAAALYRNGDNGTALQIYKDSGIWKDYVEDTAFLPFVALVQKTLNTNDPDVLRKYTQGKFQLAEKPKSLLKDEKTYSVECLSRLLPHYDFYTNRRVSVETLEKYQCGLATSGKFYQRLTFPILNNKGRIHGFSGRSVTDRQPKWLHSGKKNNWFYPFFNRPEVAQEIQRKQAVFIVESIGDSLALSEAGVYNHLVSFGLSLSPKFIGRLMNLRAGYIGLSFNNDESADENRGLIGCLKSIVKLSKYFDLSVLWITPPIKNDFGDMLTNEIRDWESDLKNKSHKENMLFAVNKLNAYCKAKKKLPEAFKKDVRKFKQKVKFYYG